MLIYNGRIQRTSYQVFQNNSFPKVGKNENEMGINKEPKKIFTTFN